MKTNIVKKPDNLPEDKGEGLSEFFFALAKTVSGIERKVVAVYDFEKQKWVILNDPSAELIEYYQSKK